MSKYNEEFKDLESIFLVTRDLRVGQFLINFLQNKGYEFKGEAEDPYYYTNDKFIKEFKKFYSKFN